MNTSQKQIFLKLLIKGDYEFLKKGYPIAAVMGSIGFIAFYFTDYTIGIYDNVFLRLIAAVLFFQLLFLSRKISIVSKILIEVIFCLTLPLFYSYLFFGSHQSQNWLPPLIFCGFSYGILTGKITNVLTVYPLCCILGFFCYDIFYEKSNMDYFFKGIGILFASNVVAILASMAKLLFSSIMIATVELYNQQRQVISLLNLKTKTEENTRLEEDLNRVKRLTNVARLSDGLNRDFNNLLEVIKTQALILKDKYVENDEKLKRISTVLNVIKKSSLFINKLTVFTQKSKLKEECINIHNLITETTGILNKSIPGNISLQMNLSAKNYVVYGDGQLLQNAFHNILLNGIQAMPDGGTMSISTKNRVLKNNQNDGDLERNEEILVFFSDNGCGMDDMIKERIFEPFFTTKGSGKGVGMGLAMVYGTIKQHNGSIEVESNPGEGSTFIIRLMCMVSSL